MLFLAYLKMPLSKQQKEFAAYVVDLMQSMGPVYAKAMFGGYGIFLEGLMFGLIADNVLYLKADKDTEHEFIHKNLSPFIYRKNGKEMKMSYYQAPEETLENVDEMNYWGNLAYKVASKAASNNKKT